MPSPGGIHAPGGGVRVQVTDRVGSVRAAEAASRRAMTAGASPATIVTISIPCAASGLPVGLQLAARPFGDAALLRAAVAAEQAIGAR